MQKKDSYNMKLFRVASKHRAKIAMTALLVWQAVNLQAEPLVLEEIVVTAQKRTQNLTDVPISVVVATGEKLQAANIVNLEELSLYTPNLYIAENPIGSFVFIRGIGSQTNQGIEQSVATYADGVYRGRMQQSRAPFLDLARIEVLRGPQGILFGQNTVGGAISIISQMPGPEREYSLSALIGSFDERELQVIVSGPVTDYLGARLAVRDYSADGYLKNTTTGSDDPERNETTARLILEWDRGNDTTIMFKFEHSEFDSRGRSTQDISNYPFDDEREAANDPYTIGTQYPLENGSPRFPNPQAIEDYLKEENLNIFDGEYSNNKLDEAMLKIDYTVEDYTITLITAWTAYDYVEHSDVDFAAVPEIQVEAIEDFSQFSQEFRLVSPKGETFEFITGLYMQSSSIDYEESDAFAANLLGPDLIPTEFQVLLDPNDVPNVNRPFTFTQDADSVALFGQGTWHLRDDFRIIAGLRYSYERKQARQIAWYEDLGSNKPYSCDVDNPPSIAELLADKDTLDLALRCTLYTGNLNDVIRNDALVTSLFPGIDIDEKLRQLLNLGTYEHTYDDQRSESKWTPSITLQADVSEDAMAYFSIASGFKAGGYDARILLDKKRADALGVGFEFQEEEVISYELGSKMTFGSAEVNFALFRTEIDDLQVVIFDGRTGFVVGNVADYLSQGLEIDGRWRFSEAITMVGSMAWLDAHFVNYDNAGCTIEQYLAEEVKTGSRFSCHQDLSGRRSFIAPEWASSLTTIYNRQIFDTLQLEMALDLNFKGDYFLDTDNDPNLHQGSFTLINWRIGLRPNDGDWKVSFLCKNLSDKIYSPNGSDIPLSDGDFYKQTAPPRSYAIQLSLDF